MDRVAPHVVLMRTRLFPLLVLASLAGCGTFGKDRALDLAQSLDLAAGWSEGLDVNVRATKYLQVGLGAYRGVYWAGLKDGVFDVWEEERSELGIGPIYQHEVFRARGSKLLDIDHPLFGDPGFREHSWDLQHLTDRGRFDFGATANAALIGFDVAFKGEEFFDFFAGCCGFDPLDDDVHTPTLDAIMLRVAGEDARIRANGVRALKLRGIKTHGYALYTAPREMPYHQQEAIRRIRDASAQTTHSAEMTPPAGAAPAEPVPPETVPADTVPTETAPVDGEIESVPSPDTQSPQSGGVGTNGT